MPSLFPRPGEAAVVPLKPTTVVIMHQSSPVAGVIFTVPVEYANERGAGLWLLEKSESKADGVVNNNSLCLGITWCKQ